VLSSFAVHSCAVTATRKYELRKRAERQQETRQRIVEATVALHSELGPARTSVKAIAERAGVQRHTVYSHFPDERELIMACSGLHLERHPLPDPEGLLEIDDPEARVRRAVELVYAYYAADELLMANIMRDVEDDPMTQYAVGVRFAPVFGRLHEVVVAGFRAGGARRKRIAGAIAVALDFYTWRTLTRAGLDERAKIETATAMTRCL
jgi:AcrR family transcriptional regulator